MNEIVYILLAILAILLIIQIVATSPFYYFLWLDIKEMFEEYKSKIKNKKDEFRSN